MLDIKVKTNEDAVNIALSNLPKGQNRAFVCFTGGKFGLGVLQALHAKDLDISNWSIFQTDERIEAESDEIIQSQLIKNLKICRGFNLSNCNFFSYDSFDEKTLEDLSRKLVNIPRKEFDITILSLGEDGHLAGHFENSINIQDGKFCYTEDSPKLPKKRISMTISQLMNSKKIILACLGDSKKTALDKLLSGESIHSELIKHQGLILVRD